MTNSSSGASLLNAFHYDMSDYHVIACTDTTSVVTSILLLKTQLGTSS